MLSSLRSSLPFTLALAIISYAVFAFLLPSIVLNTALAVTIGVLLAGIMVPILIEVKSLPSSTTTVTKTVATGSSATLYVGNLPYKANEEAVRELFQQFGAVVNVRLMKDRQTGRRRGFGFVEVTAKDAARMIQKLNDFEYEGRTLKVREAKERQDGDDSDE